MKRKKLAVLTTTVAALALVLTACSGGGSSKDSGSSSQTWSRMEKDIISTMDSSKVTDHIGGQALTDTMDGLYRYSGSDLDPAMATKVVKPTKGGTVYTFKLRDAKWSNGDEVTAKDFVYAWKRTVDPATKSQYAYLYSGIVNADDITAGKKDPDTLGVKAVDDKTFEVTLEHPIPYFETMLVNSAFFPLNEKVVKKAGDKYGTQSKYLVFNGPFKLTGWNGTNNTWTEVKNKDYWNAKNVKLDKIKVQVVKDSNTALSLYQSGKLDDATLSGDAAAQSQNDKDFQGLKQSSIYYLEFNQKKHKELQNEKIRQAISMALNRKQIVKDVIADGAITASSLVPDGLTKNPETGKDFTEDATGGSEYYKYNPTEAKKLWAEGLKEEGKTKLTLELLGDDTEGAKKYQEYLQNQLEKNLPGLEVSIASVPFKTRLSRSENGDFDMVGTAWIGDFPDAITFLDLLTSNNTYNNGKWSNKEYDALIEKSKTTDATDPEKRWQDLVDASDVLNKTMGAIPVYQSVEAHLVNSKIKDLKYSPAGNYDFVNAYLK